MDASRNDLLGELAADAALERGDFLRQATEQLRRFLDANASRIREIGGLTLIDDDPDYLSVAPDLSFRSRSRYLDDLTGEWVSETEIIESAAELVELYNPADIYQAFADAAREAAGLAPEPTATDELLETAGIAPDESVSLDARNPYAEAADDWAGRDTGEPADEEDAARRLYDLALTFQERSQNEEATLIDDFSAQATMLARRLGDLVIVDDDDERLVLEASGGFRAEVVPEGSEGEWRTLSSADELVEFYDPTDVFGDLADALAEAFPDVAPELEGEGDGAEAAAEAGEGDESDESDEGDEGDEDDEEPDDTTPGGDGRR
jgi:hypothetical protein